MRRRRLLINLSLVVLILLGISLQQKYFRRRKNVILIVLDTLRADHLGVYGYERATTPNLDGFARNNILYRNALTVAPWTPPAVGSIFTGRYPSSHGMMPPDDGETAIKKSSVLSPDNTTVAEFLHDAGYQTAGVTPNPWLKEEFGYSQGFEKYIYEPREMAEYVVTRGEELVDAFDLHRPFFLYLHFLDPHDPYDPPENFKSEFTGSIKAQVYDGEIQERINKYDGEIRYLDENLGRLFEFLKTKEVWDDSLIIIVGDHGEQFMEHGNQGHGYNLYREELQVPLMIKADSKSGTVEQIASSIDVLPSIADWAGVLVPEEADGVSLFDETALKARRGIMSEIDRRFKDIAFIRKSFSSREGMRLIVDYSSTSDNDRTKGPQKQTTFDWIKDGYGRHPILDANLSSELQANLSSVLEGALSHRVGGRGGPINEETLKQLRSLGYVGG